MGQPLTFSSFGSRPSEGRLVDFLWDFGDGTQGSGLTVQHAYTQPGVYRITLRVVDSRGREAKATRLLRVVPSGLAADFTWSPDEPTVLDVVQFTDLSQGEIVSWTWDFGDGVTSSEPNPQHQYEAKGTYTVTLTVADAFGNSHTKEKLLTVVNAPPVAEPNGPYQGALYQAILFSAKSSYDPDGEIAEYLWDFGDGGTARGETVAHVYQKPGQYTVCLTVVDDEGAEDRACTTAYVDIYQRAER